MAVEQENTQEQTSSGAAGRERGAPADRFIRLKKTKDGRWATLAEIGDERRDLNKEERVKLDKHPFDVWTDIVERYSKEGFESIEEDDMVRFKWFGIYQQRP